MATYQTISALASATASSSPAFVDLVSTAAPNITTSGAVGANVSAYHDVSAQRSAIWTMELGLAQNSSSDIAAAIKAMQYGFGEEQANGSFYNADATNNSANIESDAFFLQSFVQIYLGVKNSPFWSTYGSQLQALLPKFSTAMSYLQTQASALSTADASAANRLFFDAIAFELGGQILNNASLIQTGDNFVSQGLATQTAAGYYTEHGGYDSSYNGTSMLNVEVLMTYSSDSAQVTQLSASLAKAAAWEESRIAATGQVSVVGNTRTDGQETDPGGQPKGVNYPEVATALLYAGTILNSAAATSAGTHVADYGMVLQGGVAQPMQPATVTSITPNSSGVATGDGGNDELFATGPNQTLVGVAGGEIAFNIGRYTNTSLVVPSGGSLTEVITSAANYTLAPGVNDLAVSGSQNHVVKGNGGANYITGSNANDTINGGGDGVVIKVGTGSNMLTGGGHYDVFDFTSSSDHDNTITDFDPNTDAVDLRSLFASNGWSAATLANHIQISQQGANAVMAINPSGTASAGAFHPLVTLDNVNATQLVAGTNYLYAA